MAEHDDLLERFQPVLRYDSNEQFFADSAVGFMVNPGNRAAPQAHAEGATARCSPARSPPATSRSSSSASSARSSLRRRQPGAGGRRDRRQRQGLPRAVPRAARRAPAAQQRRLRPRDRGQRAPLAAVLAVVLLQRLPAVVRARHARGRLGDGPVPDGRRRRPSRHRRLRAAPLRRDARRGTGSRSSATGPSSTSRAARTPPTSRPAFIRPRPGTTSPTASGARRTARCSRSCGTDEPAWTRWPGRWGDSLPRTGVESNSPTGPGAKKQWTSPTRCSTTSRRVQARQGREAARGRRPARRRQAAHRVRRHRRATRARTRSS